MAVTDIITFILSIFFLIRGASRGFIRSLMVPFSIIAASIISIVYYKATKDMVASLLISLIGPLLLNFLLKYLLTTWADATNTNIKPSLLSRLGGAVLTLGWGWAFIFLTLILLTVMPPLGDGLTAVRNDVARSNSYLIAKPLEKYFFAPPKQNLTAVASVISSNDASSLAEDPRFQKVLEDPDVKKEIDAHDIVKLMANPKMMDLVQQIMSDPATMQKVMALYQKTGTH